MQFVMLVFIFGVVNLGIGFGLAMYLNQKTPAWWQNWEAFWLLCRFTGAKSATSAGRGGERPAAGAATASQSTSSGTENADEAEREAPEPERQTLKRLQKAAQIAARKLDAYMKRLKDPDSMGITATPWKFVGELQELCKPCIEQLSDMADELAGGADECGCGTSPDDPLQVMLLDLMAQLETTLSNLEYMDFDSGFSAAIERIRTETDTNLTLTQKLQETVKAELNDSNSVGSSKS